MSVEWSQNGPLIILFTQNTERGIKHCGKNYLHLRTLNKQMAIDSTPFEGVVYSWLLVAAFNRSIAIWSSHEKFQRYQRLRAETTVLTCFYYRKSLLFIMNAVVQSY